MHAEQEQTGGDRRWFVLVVVAIAQLMVVLDATIVNIALPSAQRDLGFDADVRQWIVSAYALAFGSLLLLGGRLGDLVGRRRLFVIGLLGFAVASALGGLANGFGVLVAARVLQGVFAALLAPAALAILSVTFTDPQERGKAFGIYGALAGVGAGIGLLLGGVLTDVLNWRWCLFVNLAFALPAALGARAVSSEANEGSATGSLRAALDLPGALTATLGLFAVVFGLSNAETNGWSSAGTIGSLIAGVVLLAAFVAVEARVSNPLLPLRVVLDATRGGAFLSIAVLGIFIFGAFLFLTFFLQQTLGYSPLRAGFAFMPLNLTILTVSGMTSSVLLPRFGPKPLVVLGLLLAAAASALFAQISPSSGYVDGVLPGLIVGGLGAGLLFITTYTTATLGVQPQDTGVASATLNTSQQVGGSIGLALLSTFFAQAVSDYARENRSARQVAELATIHGYTVVFWWAAGLTLAGALLVALLVRVRSADSREAVSVGS